MAAPVSVFDLAPSAFEDEDTVTDALEYDIGNLTAYDTQPLDPAALAGGRETTLKDMATASTQLLIKHLFQLPVEMSETGPLAVLPAPSTLLPREKHIPAERSLTRWQQFALEKGITKKKRERMVWDEAKKEWAPRYGYKRANDDAASWAIPVKGDEDPTIDPFEKLSLDKKKRVLRNKLSMVKNMTRAGDANKESKEMKAARLAVASISTASMGKFDRTLEGEGKAALKRKLPGEKKRVLPSEKLSDRSRDLSVISKVLDGSYAAPVKAITSSEPEPAPAHNSKKRSKSSSSRGKSPAKNSARGKSKKAGKGNKRARK